MSNTFYDRYGPWALVTGASAGIGRAFSHELARRGLNIVLVARGESRLQALADELESHYQVATRSIAADLEQPGALAGIFDACVDLDIGLFINNAGARSYQGSFLERSADEVLTTCRFNVETQLLAVHHFARGMAARGGGGIVQVSSIRGHMSTPFMAEYSAGKCYQLTLGEALHDELREAGIDVLVVSPGATITERIAVGMQPQTVVATALAQLGRRPSVIPGWRNAWVAFKYKHLNTRRYAVRRAGLWQRRYLAQREGQSPFVPPQD
jgi:short-subunit dehydrogenase